MAWIELHDTLGTHPKTYALSSALDVPQPHAIGILCLLWTWALNAAQDGDLSKFPPQAIARACFWTKKPEALLDALVQCGWVDESLFIHDWYEYAGRLIEKREDARKRVSAYRTKKEALRNANSTRNVTRTVREQYASTVPNSTVPNSTVQNNTVVDVERAREGTPLLTDEEQSTLGQAYQSGMGDIEKMALSMEMRFGEFDRITAERLMSEYTTEWVIEAMRRAATGPATARSWRYIEAILKKWKEKGGMDDGTRTMGGSAAGNTAKDTTGTPESFYAGLYVGEV